MDEVAQQVNVTRRTVESDFREVKANLLQVVQNEQLRTVKLALAELDEIWREAWILYHRPAREGENETLRKLQALDRLTRIAAEKNRLVFLSGPVSEDGEGNMVKQFGHTPRPQDAVITINSRVRQQMDTVIESLTEAEQRALAKAIRKIEQPDKPGDEVTTS